MKIFLIGFMGSGKTHWGKILSKKLNLPFFDLDEKIKEKENKSISDIFNEEGEEYFRLVEREVLFLLTESHASFVMACGGGTPCYFNNIEYLNKNGTTIWLNCSIDAMYHRLLKEKAKRPLLKELSDDQLKSYIIRKFGDRRIYYQQASVILKEEETTIDQLVNQIFQS